jgi:hypothetical protein
VEAQDVAVRVGKGATRAESRVRGVPGLCALLLRARPPSQKGKRASSGTVAWESPLAECSKPGRRGTHCAGTPCRPRACSLSEARSAMATERRQTEGLSTSTSGDVSLAFCPSHERGHGLHSAGTRRPCRASGFKTLRPPNCSPSTSYSQSTRWQGTNASSSARNAHTHGCLKALDDTLTAMCSLLSPSVCKH